MSLAPAAPDAVEAALRAQMEEGSSGPAIELRTGREADGTPYLRQFPWAFGRGFSPAVYP
jgi:hypothetical protein